MRRLFLSIATVAAVLVSGSLTNRAEAITIAPAGMQGAVQDLATIEHVHCVPRFRHHAPNNWRRADGCARRGGVVVVPGYGMRRHFHRHHHRHQRHRHHRNRR